LEVFFAGEDGHARRTDSGKKKAVTKTSDPGPDNEVKHRTTTAQNELIGPSCTSKVGLGGFRSVRSVSHYRYFGG
jgi:hypothetical protein